MLRAAATGLALALAAASAAEPRVARSRLQGGEPAGAVFFLAAEPEPGAVAVGAAHAFDRTRLAESGRLAFRAGGRPVAAASRFFARPGRDFHEPGATLRDDFVVFALEAPPRGVALLEPAAAPLRPGDRVRILGLPRGEDGPQVEALGGVVDAGEGSVDVVLDAFVDLRGWGGAPVLEARSGRVAGMLQSVRSDGERLILGIGPLGGVLAAMASPYEAGLGRLFATLAPPPSAATGHGSRRRAATGSAFGDQSPGRSSAEVAAALRRSRARRPVASAVLHLEIEHPRSGAVVGEAAGVFVAGRAMAVRGDRRRFDVVIAIDTSASTLAPTGIDVDGDGVLGVSNRGEGRIGDSTDPGDSILAAEVAAAKKLLDGLDPRSTRVALLTFAGDPAPLGTGLRTGLPVRRAAITQEPLTSDYRRLRLALDRLEERSADGMTHMAAGIDQATLELLGLRGSLSAADPESEKVVLFLTDGQPTLPHPNSEAGNVRAVLASAERARRAGIRIYSFAIGPEALEGPIAAVEMAAMTEGVFTPVRDPGSLVRFIDVVSFVDVQDVTVRNLSSGEYAYQVRNHADGSWDALLPLQPGVNRIEARARTRAGEEAVESVLVEHVPGAESPPLPAELVGKHNRLLERRLAELRLERAETVRRELILEIESERAAARERAARQRKELELEAVAPDAP